MTDDQPDDDRRTDRDSLSERAQDLAADLADADLLTDRQALAYAYRDVLGLDRRGTAAAMDCSANVVDKHLRAARTKVDQARRTIESLDALDVPTPALAVPDLDADDADADDQGASA